MLEDILFQDFLDRIGKLHAHIGKEFYAIVVVRIVGSGNHDAGLKTFLADQARHARRGNDAGEIDGHAGDVRAGFAGVHAEEHVRRGTGLFEISAERAAGGVQGGVVQRRGAGDAANTVSTEEFFGHIGATWKQIAKGPTGGRTTSVESSIGAGSGCSRRNSDARRVNGRALRNGCDLVSGKDWRHKVTAASKMAAIV